MIAREWFKRFITSPRFLPAVYILLTIIISITKYYADTGQYTGYNNYLIFKYSFAHLAASKDIYAPYYNECWDLFKYSPAFALFMGLFNLLPDLLGLIVWNLLNMLVLFGAIRALPVLTPKNKSLLLLFILPELVTALQNSQSNALIAGLIIGAFCMFEKRNVAMASLLLVLSVYIKLFGLVAFALFLFYPGKLRFIGWSLLWSILLLIVPAVIVSPSQLLFLYKSWYALLQQDHAAGMGLSLMGLFESWFNVHGLANTIFAAGVVLLLLPLIKISRYSEYYFRVLFLASILLWVVIFNHKAESPTFIIAVAGVGLWYFSGPFTIVRTSLLFFVLLLTSFSSSDLFPHNIRSEFFIPYKIKALPCIITWLVLFFALLFPVSKPVLQPGKV